MSLSTLLIKRAAENKDKIVRKQSVKLAKYLTKKLQDRVKVGYTYANVYPPTKFLFTYHFDETIKVTKSMLEDEGFILCFNSATFTRDPYYYVGLMKCSDD